MKTTNMQAMKELIFKITGPNRERKARDCSKIGTHLYWEKSVRRLNVFCDTSISSGILENGIIDAFTRSKIRTVFDELLARYEGAEGDNRPFNAAQEKEIHRVLGGGHVQG